MCRRNMMQAVILHHNTLIDLLTMRRVAASGQQSKFAVLVSRSRCGEAQVQAALSQRISCQVPCCNDCAAQWRQP